MWSQSSPKKKMKRNETAFHWKDHLVEPILSVRGKEMPPWTTRPAVVAPGIGMKKIKKKQGKDSGEKCKNKKTSPKIGQSRCATCNSSWGPHGNIYPCHQKWSVSSLAWKRNYFLPIETKILWRFGHGQLGNGHCHVLSHLSHKAFLFGKLHSCLSGLKMTFDKITCKSISFDNNYDDGEKIDNEDIY